MFLAGNWQPPKSEVSISLLFVNGKLGFRFFLQADFRPYSE